MALVRRFPFARTELHKAREHTQKTCSWCGQTRYTPGSSRPYLYVFSTHSDGGRVGVHSGLFCSTPCHDSYHEVGA